MEKQQFLQLDFGLEIPKKDPPKKLPKNEKANFVFDMMDCLTSPIIVHDSAWMDTIPKDLLSHIPMARMIACRKNDGMATILEVIAYLMPRTFEAPMPYGWGNIYTWCGLQYALQFKNKTMIDAMKQIAPENLTHDEQRDIDHLRRWIYDKRRKALKQRMKADKKVLQKPNLGQQAKLL
jgi:hypothetical protein